MAELLGELLVKIVGDTTGLTKSLSESEKKTVAFTVNIAAATIAVSKMISVVANATKEYITYGSAINDISERTSLSTEATQKWKFIAEQTGATISDVSTAVAAMTRNLGTNADTYKSLGIQVKNADGTFRTTTEIFDDTIRVLSSMQDETARDQLAFKLLGRSAQTLIPILNSGAKEIELLGNQAKNLGIILEDDAIKNADRLGDSTDALKASMTSAKNVLINEMAPALISITNGFKNLIAGFVTDKKELAAYKEATQGTITDLDKNALALSKLTKENDRLNKMLSATMPNDKLKRDSLLAAIKDNNSLIATLQLQRKELVLIEKEKNKEAGATERAAEAASAAALAAADKAAAEALAADELAKYNEAQKKVIDAEQRLVEGERANIEVLGEVARARAEVERSRLAIVSEFENSQKSQTKLEIEEIEKRRLAFIGAGVSEVEANKWAQQQILSTYLSVGQSILSTLQGLFSNLQSLYQQDAQNRIDAINAKLNADLDALDRQMEAELEAAGLSEETTLEKLQRELEAAIAEGDTETAEELQDEIDRENIKQKYDDLKEAREKQSALDTYKVELSAFKTNQQLSIANALISASEGAIAAYKALAGIPIVGPALGAAAAGVLLGYADKQVSIIKKQVPPQPPELAQGGEIGANNPTLAVIGDNQRYNEVVAPLSPDTFAKIADGILVALASRARPAGVSEATAGASSMYSGSSGGAGVTVNAGVIVANDAGLRAFARVITPYLQAESVRIG